MKIKDILPIFLFLTSFPFYAQNEKTNQKFEKIKAYKISFLTADLELTPQRLRNSGLFTILMKTGDMS
ncbi:hypothetical protein [Flavobacterium sp. N503310]|uniref:hypothetical protein n=1 Tax=Flavobacterium sp. N503310 TaxID=2986839 RepID=UPI0022257FC6|nr:hypothetical protein [Flavobacterium sp. N503310]